METFRQLGVLLWKTALQKRRHYVVTTAEVVLPAILFAVLVLLRVQGGGVFGPRQVPADIPEAAQVMEKYCETVGMYNNASLLYTDRPGKGSGDGDGDGRRNELVEKVMRRVREAVETIKCPTGTPPMLVSYRSSEEAIEIESQIQQVKTGAFGFYYGAGGIILGGVVFPPTAGGSGDGPKLDYTVRMAPAFAVRMTNELFPRVTMGQQVNAMGKLERL